MPRRCLVTGASGFIGRWLRLALRDNGFEVRSFDAQPAGVEDEVVGDLHDTAALERACSGVDVVCHLAALQSSRKHPWTDFLAANVTGTESLLKACVRHKVEHFVFFSTEMVYGRYPAPRVEEDSHLRPCGSYGRSKLMAEELCRRYSSDEGLPLTILRPCNIMGPGRRRVVDELFARIRRDAFIPLVGGRSRPYQALDVRDVVHITAQILAKRLLGVYNVGTLKPPSAFDVYSGLIRHAGSRSKLVALPAWLVRAGFRALDSVGLSPLTAGQYYRLTDSWIVDGTRLWGKLDYSLKYEETRSLIDTFDAFVAQASPRSVRSAFVPRRRVT